MTDTGVIEITEDQQASYDEKDHGTTKRGHGSIAEENHHPTLLNAEQHDEPQRTHIVKAERVDAERETTVQHDDKKNDKLAQVVAELEDQLQQPSIGNATERESLKVASGEIPQEEIAPLATPLSKLKEAIKGLTAKDYEKMGKLYYTQERLLQLVKEAESEARKIRRSKYTPASSESIQPDRDNPIDIDTLNEEERQLGIDLEANEARYAELIDKENKSGKLTNDEISELIHIWKARGGIENNLETTQRNQRAYADRQQAKKWIGVAERNLKKMWRAFNARSDVNFPQEKLRYIANVKAKNIGRTDVAIPKETSPSEVAGMITQLQNESRRK